jgi:hypothetical protein
LRKLSGRKGDALVEIISNPQGTEISASHFKYSKRSFENNHVPKQSFGTMQKDVWGVLYRGKSGQFKLQ